MLDNNNAELQLKITHWYGLFFLQMMETEGVAICLSVYLRQHTIRPVVFPYLHKSVVAVRHDMLDCSVWDVAKCVPSLVHFKESVSVRAKICWVQTV